MMNVVSLFFVWSNDSKLINLARHTAFSKHFIVWRIIVTSYERFITASFINTYYCEVFSEPGLPLSGLSLTTVWGEL